MALPASWYHTLHYICISMEFFSISSWNHTLNYICISMEFFSISSWYHTLNYIYMHFYGILFYFIMVLHIKLYMYFYGILFYIIYQSIRSSLADHGAISSYSNFEKLSVCMLTNWTMKYTTQNTPSYPPYPPSDTRITSTQTPRGRALHWTSPPGWRVLNQVRTRLRAAYGRET